MTSVYVFDFGNRVKIGRSKNINRRLQEIENYSGVKAINTFSLEGGESLEANIHRNLKQYRTVGEYFNLPFETAKQLVIDIATTPKEIIESKRQRTNVKNKTGVSYSRLWALLNKRNMKKTQLREAVGIGPTTLAKLGRNGYVSLEVLESICSVLDCRIEDIMEFLPDAKAGE